MEKTEGRVMWSAAVFDRLAALEHLVWDAGRLCAVLEGCAPGFFEKERLQLQAALDKVNETDARY